MKLRIIPTSEGYFDALTNQYIYNYTDHLGNVRLSYSDTNKDGIIQPRQYHVSQCSGNWNPPFEFPICTDYWKPGEIVEVNNYYPFGLMHNYTATTTNPYQLKYNGKELQETGMYDYGARFYMPDIGRWGVIDPLAEASRRLTPYHYGNNNPIRFIDPDGRLTMDNLSTYSRGSAVADFMSRNGFGDDYLPMLYRDDAGMMIVNEALGENGQGGGSAVNIILNFIRDDKEGLGNFINSEFEKNGWHVIDVTSLADALTKLTSYLGDNQADNIYINAHGLASDRYVYDENGQALRDSNTGNYKMVGDTGFYTPKDKILGSDLQQYISDKKKLSSDKLSSIDSFIGIANYVKSGKNLIMGSCWTVRYDDLFGVGISSIVKSRDIFVNRDYSSNYTVKGKGIIPFQNFINYNQTSPDNYIEGWVWYKDGVASKRNFNIIMTKYGVKTVK